MSAKAFLRGFAVLSLISVLIVPLAASHAQTPVLPTNAWAEQAVQGQAPEVKVVELKNAVPIGSSVTPATQTAVKAPIKTNTQVPAELPKKQVKPASVIPRNIIPRNRPVSVVQAPILKTVSFRTGRSYVISSTAYNSLSGQTDSTPFITATGARTRFGIVALSRDMLRSISYKSRVMIEDLTPGSRYNSMLANTVFVVEDTMNPRIRGRVDMWMSSRSQAFAWGHRRVRITVIN